MLVLTRTLGEKIVIDERITLVIVRIGPGNVRIGIEAPREMRIRRAELEADTVEIPIPPGASIDGDTLAALAGV